MRPEIKAVLFDLGNVLVKFDARLSCRAFAETCHCSEEEVWKAFFVSDLERVYTRGEISSAQFVENVNRLFGGQLSVEQFSKLWNEIFTENPGMEVFVRKLKKKYPLYVISNTNEMHWTYLLKQFSVLQHFTQCFPSHEVGMRKPDPNMFRYVLGRIGFPPEETVFIDDVPEFAASARSVGIHGIVYVSQDQLEMDLQRLGVQG